MTVYFKTCRNQSIGSNLLQFIQDMHGAHCLFGIKEKPDEASSLIHGHRHRRACFEFVDRAAGRYLVIFYRYVARVVDPRDDIVFECDDESFAFTLPFESPYVLEMIHSGF